MTVNLHSLSVCHEIIGHFDENADCSITVITKE
jgi:hypothetical protein